jgi:hypothetical protein
MGRRTSGEEEFMASEPGIADRLYTRLDEIERLAECFVDGTLPCPEWTHRAHLAVGLWHVREYPPDEALGRMRDGIQRRNAACGVVTTLARGYHETLTRFYMWLIGKYLTEVADRSDWVAVTNGLIERYGSRDVPLGYYTRERLMSSEARAGWVSPDLRPLE